MLRETFVQHAPYYRRGVLQMRKIAASLLKIFLTSLYRAMFVGDFKLAPEHMEVNTNVDIT